MSDIANDIIRATSDIFIASLLSAPKNEPILRNLVNAVLKDSGGVPVVSAQVLNPINVKEFLFDKGIVLDVRVEDETGRIFNIEVQTSQHPAFAERILFGWADTFSSQLHAGHAYQQLRPVFCIVITEFKIFDGVDGVHLVFELRERNHPNLSLSNHLEIHFLRLDGVLQRPKMLENVEPNLRHWINFLVFGGTKEEDEMSQILENDPILMAAVGELRRYSSDPEMRELERRRKLWKLEQESGLYAAKAEGREEGREEGKALSVLAVLQARFKVVSKSVSARVLSIKDTAVLDFLTAQAATCQSLDEFEKALR